MKAKPADVASILKQPPAGVRLLLMYGPDAGLVSARGRQAVRAICADASDAFLVSKWSEDQLLADPPKLADDINAISLIGGRRVIRIQPAGDRLTALLKPLLDAGDSDTLLVVMAAELPPRSSLRKLAEGAANALAIPCYEDNVVARRALVQESCRSAGLQISRDALAWLVENLGSDHGISRQELEKLILYMGPVRGESREITLQDARAVVGDSAAWRIDDIADSMLLGEMDRLERNFASALQAGASGVRILNAVGATARRIHAFASQVERGSSVSSAMQSQRPPVPFFRRDMVAEQIRRWTRRSLDRVLVILSEAETECKNGTGGIGADVLLCRQALWRIAERAAQSSRSSRTGSPAGG